LSTLFYNILIAGRNRLSQNIASLYRYIWQIYINFRG